MGGGKPSMDDALGHPSCRGRRWRLHASRALCVATRPPKSYLLVGLLLRGLLRGDGLLRAALLEHRLGDDGLGLLGRHGRHVAKGTRFCANKRESVPAPPRRQNAETRVQEHVPTSTIRIIRRSGGEAARATGQASG